MHVLERVVKDVTRELSLLAIYRIDFRIWHVRLRVLMENPKGGAWLGDVMVSANVAFLSSVSGMHATFPLARVHIDFCQ